MEYRMKMLLEHYEQMRGCLIHDTAVEQGCFLLCSTANLNGLNILLVKEVLPLDSDDLLTQGSDILSVKPGAMLRAARLAQKGGLSVCMVHTHPMVTGAVDFSAADDVGNARTFAFFNRMNPGGINSCLVWDGRMLNVAGRVYRSHIKWNPIGDVEVVSHPYLVSCTLNGQSPKNDPIPLMYERQARLLGETGQLILSKKRIAIVGAGGIGSCAGVILGHSGIGGISSIDFDHIEDSNRPRTIDATPSDVDVATAKVHVLKRYLNRVRPECEVEVFFNPVEDPDLFEKLASKDLIICATDDTCSRAFLNQLCQQYYIPLLDLGVQFVAEAAGGAVTNEVGKVNLVLPGSPCLVCCGHIDPERLRIEGLPKEQRERLRDEGYIRGLDEAEPSMMPYNMEVAARGAQIVINQFTGLACVDPTLYERFSFIGLAGKPHHKHIRKRSDPECMFCVKGGRYLGAGDPWRPLVSKSAGGRSG